MGKPAAYVARRDGAEGFDEGDRQGLWGPGFGRADTP